MMMKYDVMVKEQLSAVCLTVCTLIGCLWSQRELLNTFLAHA